ncbi:pheromone-processing carboxypeptidase KEX1 [Coprinopsis marcescibilis]|uniref:Pheromone-processing carboxypeptidase KEX1 n=1 Tax=Coprinopsis marcescibilis TaxID=230819 RepID=A0A5C3KQ84_COPMA|nr:pheromone-processing carboxypeptidase KEX1 [Coprinopsis marcescibilis]
MALWTWLVSLALCCYVQGAATEKIPSAASFYVQSIPGIVQNPDIPLQIYSGHLAAEPNMTRVASNDVTAHLFFVLVKNRRVADKQRVVFWFNGGPGCSSFDGLMMEVGPWRWDGKPVGSESFVVKEGGWEEYTTMVYVDQPPGTGFSFSSTDQYAHTMKDASGHFMEFLKNFYAVFPEYKNVDTYLAGESFAGQWIPFFAEAILDSNFGVPLRGVAIGNGWMDAKSQYLTYLDYAMKMSLLEEGTEDYKHVKTEHERCETALASIKDNPVHVRECGGVINGIIHKKKPKVVNGKEMCMNMYDIRYEDTSPACGLNWPPEMHAITHFLDRQDVVNAIHAQARPGAWVECRGDVHRAFKDKTEQSGVTVLPKVLQKIPVLIFAGDQDLICNYAGLERMMRTMTWNGETGLGTVQTKTWSVNNTNAGTWVTSRNLTYVKVFNASHMVPFDLPHVSHDMMLRFMGADFSKLVGGSAKIPSSLGHVSKPVFVGEEKPADKATAPAAKTPEQEKAMWEAYYNAGSAALVLVLIMLVIGLFTWYRVRKNRLRLPANQTSEAYEEEQVPLNTSMRDEEAGPLTATRKGKGKAEPVFDVGDSDDDEPYNRTGDGTRR